MRTAVKITQSVFPAGVKIDDIAIGGAHACAAVGGKAYCWGRNWNGELGRGVVEYYVVYPDAQPVVGIEGKYVTQVEATGDRSCAVASDEVFCWGAEWTGQIGKFTDFPTPWLQAGVLAGKKPIGIEMDNATNYAIYSE
jgi:alpha-tubulin suppressor-like RCC1 family protein